MAIRRIGQILVDLGYITDENLELLLEEQQQQPGELLGKIAEEMGLITDDQLAQALAEQMAMHVINLSDFSPGPDLLEKISETMAQLYQVVPVRFEDNRLTIATASPQNLSVQDELRTFLGYEIEMVVATDRDLRTALDRYYNAAGDTVGSIITELESDDELRAQAEAFSGDGPIDLTGAEALADSAPVRKLLNMVLLLAIKDHASDVHFEPFEDEFRIRIKSDGVLYEMVPPPRHLAFAITTRIKVMANLDIAERRLPQDGRIELTVGGHPVDLRISVLPTMFGESVVMRVLDRGNVSLDLERIGMREDDLLLFRQLIRRPNGIVIVTGPTGSGKTTSLYSALNELNKPDTKILTSEDPVEYDIDGLIQ
ncbi:MAG: ATPase, T2SS/T4P/T4SS family, partial [Pirellulaceae bacterium]|nr:ATPase, T2SS/T4P/T4SS family [Pirellulaceae bacterium]